MQECFSRYPGVYKTGDHEEFNDADADADEERRETVEPQDLPEQNTDKTVELQK